jgi:hypothetical protein
VFISELKDYQVAAIQFAGTLSDSNVTTHRLMLKNWLKDNSYIAIGEPIQVAYNGPLTLPFWRKNEILIAIK